MKVKLLFITFILLMSYAYASPNQPNGNPIGIRLINYQGMDVVHIWNNVSIMNNNSQWADYGHDYYISAEDWISISNVKARWLNEQICLKSETHNIKKCTEDLNVEYNLESDNITYARASGTLDTSYSGINITFQLNYTLTQPNGFIRKNYFIDYDKNNPINLSISFKYYNISIGGTPINDRLVINSSKTPKLRNLNGQLVIWEGENSQAHEVHFLDKNESKYWKNFWNFKYPYAITINHNPNWFNSVVTNTHLIGYENPVNMEFFWIDANECDCGRNLCSYIPFYFDFLNNIHTVESYVNYSVAVFVNSQDPDASCTMTTNLQYSAQPNGAWNNLDNSLTTKHSGFGCFFEDRSSCQRASGKGWNVYTFMGLNSTGNYSFRFFGNIHHIASTNYTIYANNSLPLISLIEPPNYYNQTDNQNITLECLATDLQGIDNMTLYFNGTAGVWVQNQTYNVQHINGSKFWAKLDNNYTSEENYQAIQSEGVPFIDGRKGQGVNFSRSGFSPKKISNLTYDYSINMSEGSISGWFYHQGEPAISLNYGMFGINPYNTSFIFGSPSNFGDYWVVYYHSGTIYSEFTSANTRYQRTKAYNMDNGGWHHFIVTWKDFGINVGGDIFINGIQFMRNNVYGIKPHSNPNFTIGSFSISSQFSTTDYTWGGVIDEVVVYDHSIDLFEAYDIFINGTARHNFTVENINYGSYNWTCTADTNFLQKENYWSNKTLITDNRTFSIFESIAIQIAQVANNYWKIAIMIIVGGSALIIFYLIKSNREEKCDENED